MKHEQKKKELVLDALRSGSSGFTEELGKLLTPFRREKITRPHIYVGMNSCGIIAGAQETLLSIRQYLQEHALDAEVIQAGCSGLCNDEPVVEIQLPGINRLRFAPVTVEMVSIVMDSALNRNPFSEILAGQYHSPGAEAWPSVPFLHEMEFFRHQKRIITQNLGVISPTIIEDYISRGGYFAFLKTISNYTCEKVCQIVEDSGLQGRGGSGYPTAAKWKQALNTAADQKVFICNADESDPGAFIDRALLEGNPHLIIEGLAIGAYGIGAEQAYIYLKHGYSLAKERLEHAIQQAQELGLLGDNIFGSGYKLQVYVKESPGAYICGEETALIRSLEGKRGIPEIKPPYPATKGLFGKPTVVNNVKTLANIPFIIANGPLRFHATGTAISKGTKLFSLGGHARNTGIIEVEMGTKLRDVVEKIAGGVAEGHTLKAIHLGGPAGTFIPADQLDIPVDFAAFAKAGVTMGSGGMTILNETTCVVDLVKYFIGFLNRENCGKCIPCREGMRKMSEILEATTHKPEHGVTYQTLERFKGIIQLETLAEVARETSLCGLGKSAANPILSSLKWFRDEFEEHIFDRKCTAGVCHRLRTYYILPEMCTGCHICLLKCPANAIIGTKQSPHFIIEEKCTGCGICEEVCKFNAVLMK